MGYQSEAIAPVINRLNVCYYLPAIQREFVWSPDQIVGLFDSIMRGYPISSFLFWELQPENRSKWEIYKFLDHYQQGITHNELAGTDGIPQLFLILDGQQRLTSLLIGLKGAYSIKKKYLHWSNPKAWARQNLYIDLLKDSKVEEEDGESGIRYGFQFFDSTPKAGNGQNWMKVGRILDFDSEDRFNQFVFSERDKLPDDITKKQMNTFEMNLRRLREAIWKDSVISYYVEHDQIYDRVLDIFVRANMGGTKLTKSDLLLSMVTSKWSGINAREEIFTFVDRINNDLTRKNIFDKDFVMKSCLVLSDLPVQYRVENFSKTNLDLIQKKWTDIKSAIEAAVDLVNYFGIDRDTLTSANALIPIIYYFSKHKGITLRGTTPFDVQNATNIRCWLLMVLLNNVFGGQSDRLLTDIRDGMKKPGDFPVKDINKVIGQSKRTASFDEYALDNFLSITYGKQVTFLALSLLYDDNGWGTMIFQQDHIFPQALFNEKRMNELGIPEAKRPVYMASMNRIGNLQLLLPSENQGKSAKDIDHWLTTRDKSFRTRHLIPDDDNLLRFDRFEKFLKAREELIKTRLKSLFASYASGGV